jgi:hypothetical protein
MPPMPDEPVGGAIIFLKVSRTLGSIDTSMTSSTTTAANEMSPSLIARRIALVPWMTLHLPIRTQGPFLRAADGAKGLSARNLARAASEIWRARR